jgi:hypothetical protein
VATDNNLTVARQFVRSGAFRVFGDCPTTCVTGRDLRVRDPVSRAREDHDRDHYFFSFCFVDGEVGAGVEFAGS